MVATVERQRFAGGAGIAAPVALVIGVVVADLTWPGFSHRTQNISDLGGVQAPYPLVQNVALVVFGLLVAMLATGLARHRLGRRAPALLVGFFGAMMVVQGLTPCTPGCQEGTVVDVAHVVAALTGSLAVAVAMLLTWRRARREPGGTAYGLVSAVTGWLTLAFLAAWLVAANVDPDQWHAGILQRLTVTAVLVWLVVTGRRLSRPASP